MDKDEEEKLAVVFKNTTNPLWPLDVKHDIDGTPYFLWSFSDNEEVFELSPLLAQALQEYVNFTNPNFEEVRQQLTDVLWALSQESDKNAAEKPDEDSSVIYLGKAWQKSLDSEVETAELITA